MCADDLTPGNASLCPEWRFNVGGSCKTGIGTRLQKNHRHLHLVYSCRVVTLRRSSSPSPVHPRRTSNPTSGLLRFVAGTLVDSTSLPDMPSTPAAKACGNSSAATDFICQAPKMAPGAPIAKIGCRSTPAPDGKVPLNGKFGSRFFRQLPVTALEGLDQLDHLVCHQ